MQKRKLILNVMLYLVVLVVLAFWLYNRFRVYGFGTPDDAYISLRYSENFANGHGLVWNIGERVEGYTTFLWVFLMGTLARFGMDPIYAGRTLGCLFTGLTYTALFALPLICRDINKWTSLIAVALLASCAIYASWTFSLMEIPLLAFLLLLTAILLTLAMKKDGKVMGNYLVVTGFSIALCVMARPDAGLILIASYCTILVCSENKKVYKALLITAGFVGLYGPYYLWRLNYYGEFLPNTFYVKVGHSLSQVVRGQHYVVAFFGYMILPLALMIPGLSRKNIGTDKGSMVCLALSYTVLHSMYIASIGGDWSGSFRFFGPIIPLVCIGSAIGLMSLNVPALVKSVVFFVALGYSLFNTFHHRTTKGHILRDYRLAEHGINHGTWMRENLSPDTLVALNCAGAVPYFSKLPMIDMLGLNDKVIAKREIKTMGQGVAGHEKGDGLYVLTRRPDQIMFNTFYGRVDPKYISETEAKAQPEFDCEYKLHEYNLYDGRGAIVYVKRSTIPKVLGLHTFFSEQNTLQWGNKIWQGSKILESFETDTCTFTNQNAEESIGYGNLVYRQKPMQFSIKKFHGSGLLNTYHDVHRDHYQVTYLSEPFMAEEDTILFFLVGGGRGRGVGVSLMEGETVLESRRGYQSEILRPEVFNLSLYPGKELHVRVFDQETGGWGHVLADQFVIMKTTDKDSLPEIEMRYPSLDRISRNITRKYDDPSW